MRDRYDLIVIGGGIAGTEAAIHASDGGLTTALIERVCIGGTCLNYGCIPSKSYLSDAHRLYEIRSITDISRLDKRELFHDTWKRTQNAVEYLREGMVTSLKGAGVDIIIGTGKIRDYKEPFEVEVNDRVLVTDRIIIATGSRPIVDHCKGIEDEINEGFVFTNETFFGLDALPSRLVIVGGGVSGVEMAVAFSTFGTSVTVLESKNEILSGWDDDVVTFMRTILKKSGVLVYTGVRVEEISEGTVLYYSESGTEHTEECDAVYLAAGRMGYRVWDDNLSVDDRGFFKVTDSYETNIKNIYSIGDAAGGMMLAHKAKMEAKKCVNRVLGIDSDITRTIIPRVIYSFPECVQIGECSPQDSSLTSQRISMNYSGRYVASLRETEVSGFIKLYFDLEHRISGAVVVSNHAAEISGLLTVLVTDKVRCDKIHKYVYAHPTEHELIGLCAEMYMNTHMKG